MSKFHLSPLLRSRVEQSLELGRWIDANKPGAMVAQRFADSVACAHFSLALEHHLAVSVLFQQRLPSSAFALVRSIFDAYWRGEWAHKAATEEDLERFRVNKHDPKAETALKALKAKAPEFGGIVEQVKRNNWGALSGFTHGGFAQISHQLTGGHIGPRFPDTICIAALQFSDTFASVAAVSLAEIVGVDTAPFEERAKQLIASPLERPCKE